MSVPTLQKIYESRGYSRKDIADLMGVSEDLVYRWERGTRGVNSDKLIKLAEFLDCSSDQILGIEPFVSIDNRLHSLTVQQKTETGS